MLLINKTIFLYTVFLVMLCPFYVLAKTQTKKVGSCQISPSNTVFLFDFNGVVATPEISRITWSSIAAIVGSPWVLLLLLKPFFYRDVVRLCVRNIYVDGTHICGLYSYLDHFQKAHTYFTPDVKEALLKAFNQHKPITTTFEVIAKLKKSGYRVYIFTNKDRVSLLKYVKPYLQKFYKLDLDNFFDGYFCADDHKQKPDASIYNWVVQELCKDGIEHLIFFDDNKINVEGASETNFCFKAFQFIKTENLQDHKIINEALMWNKNQKNIHEHGTII